jgi:hypothetical protein
MTSTPSVAYFITPHGFGHASRAAAVMAALTGLVPEIRFELFTTCPRWIFEESIGKDFGYHAVQTDIGLVQTSPLQEDLAATCLKLEQMLPFGEAMVLDLADRIKRLACRLVICDIAPLGIAVARAAGLPIVLIENFTWDWIYGGYLASEPYLQPYIDYLAGINQMVDHHIQTRPACRPSEKAICVDPVSRKARRPRDEVRHRLGVPDTAKMVLVTMGGVPDRFDFLTSLPADLGYVVVVPGANGLRSPHPKIILLPTHSPFFHPDLMMAADALVGKAGYSTVAEAYQAGIPFGYITRPASPESAVLEDFITRHLPARSISAETYHNGCWTEALAELLKLDKTEPPGENGADQAASYIYRICETYNLV